MVDYIKFLFKYNLIILYILLFPIIVLGSTTYNSGDVVITSSGDYVIQNGVSSIHVESGVVANIRLENVTIDKSSSVGSNYSDACAFVVEENSHASIILSGKNILKSGRTTSKNGLGSSKNGGVGFAGLQVNRGADVEILGTGSLVCYGGSGTTSGQGTGGAGIGGGYNPNLSYDAQELAGFTPGSITINGGTIEARGGDGASGIGGGWNGAASETKIEINAGNIKAYGGNYGAGIGDGDSWNDVTSEYMYKRGLYYIKITGGTVYAVGGCAATGIGACDRISSGENSVTDNSNLNIQFLGGEIYAEGGTNDIWNSGGGAGVGAGGKTRMDSNSIVIGSEARVKAVGYKKYAVHNDYKTIDAIPVVSIDTGVISWMMRFSSSSSYRTLKVTDEDGNEIYTYTVPSQFESVFLSLGNRTGIYYVEFGSKLYKVDIDGSISLVSGELSDEDDGLYSKWKPDNYSLTFDNIIIPDKADKLKTAYTYLSTQTGYRLYVKSGVTSINLTAYWSLFASTNDQIKVEIDYLGNTYTFNYGSSQSEYSLNNIEIDNVDKNNTLVTLKKTDRHRINESASWEVSNPIVYTYLFIPQKDIDLSITDVSKVYDGKPVSVSLENIDYSETPYSDLFDIIYNYYLLDADGNRVEKLDSAPINVGYYEVEAILDKESYLATGSRKFNIDKREIYIKEVSNDYKEYDGNTGLVEDQRDLGIVKWYNLVGADEIEFTFDFDNSYYESPNIGISPIHIVGLELLDNDINKNYILKYVDDTEKSNVVSGEIFALRRLLFTSDNEVIGGQSEIDSWDKWKKDANIALVRGSNQHSFNVFGRTVNNGADEEVYKVDIIYNDIKFDYSPGTWNPYTHEYSGGYDWMVDTPDANKVTIVNRSNRDIKFKTVSEMRFLYESSSMKISTTVPDDGEILSYKSSDDSQYMKDFYVNLTGNPEGYNLKDYVLLGTVYVLFETIY